MQVKAAAGLKVPMEDKPHDYITDAESVDVPDSAYYQRRISDGDLVEVTNPLPNPLPLAGEGAAVKGNLKSLKGAA